MRVFVLHGAVFACAVTEPVDVKPGRGVKREMFDAVDSYHPPLQEGTGGGIGTRESGGTCKVIVISDSEED